MSPSVVDEEGIITRKLSLMVARLVAMAGCDSGPTGPTAQPSPQAVSIAIAPATDLITIKSSESFSATTSAANGTSRAATATWSSDNAAVASVDAAGRTTGNASACHARLSGSWRLEGELMSIAKTAASPTVLSAGPARSAGAHASMLSGRLQAVVKRRK